MSSSAAGKRSMVVGRGRRRTPVEDIQPALKPRRGGRSTAEMMAAGGFLLPNLVLITVFLLVPLVLAFVISFQKLGSLGPAQYLGINNYVDLLRDNVFWQTLFNTGVFSLFSIPIAMGLGLAIAVLLNTVMPGRTLYRSIIFLPLVISGISTGVLGAWMFDEYNGFINKLLHDLHLGAPHWQSNGTWAMASIIIVTVWQRVGFDMLIYLAGLQGVSPEVQEAATVDGASAWQRFRRVTFPLLGPSTFFLLIMNMIYSFQVFDTVWAMTRGGPDFSTSTVVTYAYRTSFDEHGPQQLGYGAAVGVVIYLITLAITAAQWRFSNARDAGD